MAVDLRHLMPVRRQMQRNGTDLSKNELIHPRADEVLRAVGRALSPQMLRHYPATAESAALLAAYFGTDTDHLVLTPGSDAAIRLVCEYHRRTTQGSGTVLLQDPNYPAWADTARLLGLPLRRMTLDDGDLAGQQRRLLHAARTTANALVAVSVPNGPAGGVLSPAALTELCELAQERRHLLVLDSCYQAFHGPLTEQVARAGDRVLVVQSLSKSHALAGSRIAVLIGAPELIGGLAAGPLEHAVSGTSLLASRVAVEHHEVFQDVWDEIRQMRTRAAEMLHGLGHAPLPSGGNFITVPLGRAQRAAACAARLADAGYSVCDLSDVPGLTGCVRFTVADGGTTELFLPVLRRVVVEAPLAPPPVHAP
ncbi:aminotransferase class I/II-fold pyridoxal phosphate-dependent enzyme [Streptomyces noursei]|uniref:aminotransferase class I/II-fold pyridoxal phosphate-dependent enzyme n=1 Tax=Streptomyces noursei TaxID=1971 RepID=UPI00332997AD